MTRRPPSPRDPRGDGLAVRTLRIAPGDVVKLGALLAGYDGLASVHGDRDEVLFLVTTLDRAAELDAVLAGLHDSVAFRVVPPEG